MSRALGRETPPAPPSFALPLCLPRTRGLLSQNHYPLRILAVVCPNYLGRRPPTSSASPSSAAQCPSASFQDSPGLMPTLASPSLPLPLWLPPPQKQGGMVKGARPQPQPTRGSRAAGGGGLRKSGPAASTAPKSKSYFFGRFCCNVLSWASAKLEHKMHRMQERYATA